MYVCLCVYPNIYILYFVIKSFYLKQSNVTELSALSFTDTYYDIVHTVISLRHIDHYQFPISISWALHARIAKYVSTL